MKKIVAILAALALLLPALPLGVLAEDLNGRSDSVEREFTEVDLSGLENTTAADLSAVNKILSKSGTVSPVPEMSMDFAIYMAARVAHLPVEFFQRMPSREAIRLKNTVTGFLYGGDGNN